MNIRLWKPSSRTIKKSNLFKFEKFISKRFNKNFNTNYKKIHDWSIKNQGEFWSSVWDFSRVMGSKGNTKIKKLTRGVPLNQETYLSLVESLDISEKDKKTLLSLTPSTYIGEIKKILRRY